MTEKQKDRLIKDPKAFLKSCWYHEQHIRLKLEEIRHYKELAESITAELKPVAVSGLLPVSKVENCVLAIVGIQEDIRKEIPALRADLEAIREAVGLLEDEAQRKLMEARYIRHMKWEEIAVLLAYTHRRTLQLHSAALKEISKRIISL